MSIGKWLLKNFENTDVDKQQALYEKSVEKNKNVSKKDSERLPDEIMHRVRIGARVSHSLIAELPLYQRRIIEEYNWYVHERGTNRNDERVILHELRRCTTFRELQHIMMRYRK